MSAGKHAELSISKLLYEPKYGNPMTIEEFKPLHRAFIEDILFGWSISNTSTSSIHELVAILKKSN